MPDARPDARDAGRAVLERVCVAIVPELPLGQVGRIDFFVQRARVLCEADAAHQAVLDDDAMVRRDVRVRIVGEAFADVDFAQEAHLWVPDVRAEDGVW